MTRSPIQDATRSLALAAVGANAPRGELERARRDLAGWAIRDWARDGDWWRGLPAPRGWVSLPAREAVHAAAIQPERTGMSALQSDDALERALNGDR